jgi:hypothetical protein
VRANDFECVLEGIVRASYAQSGMGVEFISNEYQHRTRVEELIRQLVSQREVPRVFVGRKENSHQSPSKSPASAVADSTDPLLNLIRSGDSLSLDEFQEHLKAQRLGPLEHES